MALNWQKMKGATILKPRIYLLWRFFEKFTSTPLTDEDRRGLTCRIPFFFFFFHYSFSRKWVYYCRWLDNYACRSIPRTWLCQHHCWLWESMRCRSACPSRFLCLRGKSNGLSTSKSVVSRQECHNKIRCPWMEGCSQLAFNGRWLIVLRSLFDSIPMNCGARSLAL